MQWENIGEATGSFMPQVSIDDGVPVDIAVSEITLLPGYEIGVNFELGSISAETHIICPVPN